MTFLLYRIKSGAGRGALPPRPITHVATATFWWP